MAKQKKIMRALKLHEISIVDRPAQEGANVLIMKRKGEPGYDPKNPDPKKRGSYYTGKAIFEKGVSAIMTGPQENHQHSISMVGGFDGGRLTHGRTSWDDDHDHPWVMQPDGTVMVGLHEGHSHEGFVPGELQSLKSLPKEGTSADLLNKREDSRSNSIEKEDNMSDEKIEAMAKRLERAEKVAELSDAEKVYFKTLETDKQDEFLAKADKERKADLKPFETDEAEKEEKAKTKKAAEAAGDKVVVYKSRTGDEYFNTDDARFVAQVKINDDLAEKLEKSDQRLADQAYAKRAKDELGHLPGDESAHIALLKSVDGIKDKDQREQALAALKAKNDQHGMVFKTIGQAGMTEIAVEKGSAEDQLDELAKKRATADNTDFHTAYAKVCETPEGAQLYAKSVAA